MGTLNAAQKQFHRRLTGTAPVRWRRPTQPDGIRLAYYVLLRRAVILPLAEDIKHTVGLLPSIHEDAFTRADGFRDRAREALERLRQRIADSARSLAAQAQTAARAIFNRTASKTDRELPTARPAPTLQTVAENFVSENVALVTGLPVRALAEVEAAVLRAVSTGNRKQLAVDLRERVDVTKNRAKLIARDQVGKLYGQLVRERQQANGIEKFIWRTQLDKRVRDSHAELEGTVWRWDSPPSIGIPGEPINCRCYGAPLI